MEKAHIYDNQGQGQNQHGYETPQVQVGDVSVDEAHMATLLNSYAALVPFPTVDQVTNMAKALGLEYEHIADILDQAFQQQDLENDHAPI